MVKNNHDTIMNSTRILGFVVKKMAQIYGFVYYWRLRVSESGFWVSVEARRGQLCMICLQC